MSRASSEAPLVVIIENDRAMAEALSLLVEDWGYEAVATATPAMAVRRLGPRVHDIAAIIADYHLDDGFTGMKGATALAQASGHRVPTIVTTGHPVMAEHENLFSVLWKPFDPSVLQRWLVDHVGRASTARIA
ncbi:MAG TPA: response regulator [Hyphomicrobiaceae bacterium]|nr:response regulator [Hyphomicrobiaceae bacterium]